VTFGLKSFNHLIAHVNAVESYEPVHSCSEG